MAFQPRERRNKNIASIKVFGPEPPTVPTRDDLIDEWVLINYRIWDRRSEERRFKMLLALNAEGSRDPKQAEMFRLQQQRNRTDLRGWLGEKARFETEHPEVVSLDLDKRQ